jgi:hypothetical protein
MKATLQPKPKPVLPTLTIPDDLFNGSVNTGCKHITLQVEKGAIWSGYAIEVTETGYSAAGSLIFVPSITPERLVHG